MERKRAREFGIRIGSLEPGRLNAITDVKGVGVGHVTLIQGESIRTGVTAITPHPGNIYEKKVIAAVEAFNAFGKSTGLLQVMHMGVIETPILLTDTLNTWRVADAVLDYFKERYNFTPKTLNPIVGETNGGFLNDSFGRHVRKEHVFEAIDKARSTEGRGMVEEGNVGGGTPMIGYGLKGGIGTASRMYENITVGVLVQLNCGRREDLIINGVPVGKELNVPRPQRGEEGSIMIIVATDLALTSRQLWKLARRSIIGLARTGSYSSVTSGDFVIAFTTGEKKVEDFKESIKKGGFNGNELFLNPLYKAVAEATEEAIINALFKAETMTGVNNNIVYELPYDQVEDIFKKYGRTID